MSAPIFRNSMRNIVNKRFYSAPAGEKPAAGSGGLLLGLAVAAGAGYYFYSKDANKGTFEKQGEAVDTKIEEAKQNLAEKVEETKAKYEQTKTDASEAAKEKYENAKQAAVEKGQQLQNDIGEKVSQVGESIKDRS